MRRRAFMTSTLPLLLLGASCAAQGGASPPAPPPAERGLLDFYQALADRESGRRTRPVTVLQIGDSHTANDAFGTRMREVLQDRFGAIGRGLLPPGIPFATYAPSLVHVTASHEWRAITSMDRSNAGPFGLTGLRQTTSSAGAVMTLETDLPGGLTIAEVEVLHRPDGGRIEVLVNGRRAGTIATDSPVMEARFVHLPTRPDTSSITLRTFGDGPVDILSWFASQAGPGLLYSNLGTIGATIALTERWDPDIVRVEMGHFRPSLLLIAFGTNEGFRPEPDPDYGKTFTSAVRRLQAAAPGASILVMGPPDGDWSDRREGGLPAHCPDAGPERERWRKPPHLAATREAQRRAAEANGWAFWDWSAAMGGACTMAEWTQLDPPLAMPDHVHLRTAGYRRTADVLLERLLNGYDRFKRH